MMRVKTSLLALGMMGCLWAGGTQVYAENPANWNFDVTTTGQDVSWTSSTAVDTTYPLYDYTYQITTLEADLQLLGWTDLIPYVGSENLSGSGQEAGPPPVDLANDFFSYPDIPPYNVAANVHIYVDASGYGHVDMTNIALGEFLGLNIDAVHAAGTMNVTGVPEPVSLVLLGGGMLGLLSRRRR